MDIPPYKEEILEVWFALLQGLFQAHGQTGLFYVPERNIMHLTVIS